jgi:ABC-2 type transport system permease protein
MTGALKYELMRIRTIASTYWITGLAIVLSLGVALLIGLGINASGIPEEVTSTEEATTFVITGGASFPGIPALVAIFCTVLGVLTFGHEYQHGMSKATLTAIPDRVHVFLAKAIVLGAWVAVLTVVTILLNTLLAMVMLENFNLGGSILRPLLNYVLFSLGFAWSGMALAAILRSQVGAMVVALVWPLVLEQIIFNVTRFATSLHLGWLANLMPAAAGRRSIFSPYETLANPVSFDQDTHVWGLGPSMLVFWVGIAVVISGAAASFLKRDA